MVTELLYILKYALTDDDVLLLIQGQCAEEHYHAGWTGFATDMATLGAAGSAVFSSTSHKCNNTEYDRWKEIADVTVPLLCRHFLYVVTQQLVLFCKGKNTRLF